MQHWLQKLIVLFLFSSLLLACNSTKKALEEGNYDKAITDSSLALKKNKNNKRQALILEDAYKKATSQDLQRIAQLKQTTDQNPLAWAEIYNIYDRMLIREIAIVPLLPLEADGRELSFKMPNVNQEADEAKLMASRVLYKKAEDYLKSADKASARKAYEALDQLIEFNYNYEDAKSLREEAKIKGSVNVLVSMINETKRPLPANFESDLLGIRDGEANNPWIAYHTQKNNSIPYDDFIEIAITDLTVGRNDEQRRQYRDQKQVIVGYKEQKNSKGETVRVPQYQTVYADVLEVLQSKPIRVQGIVTYKNKQGQELRQIPVQRQEAWTNNYAQFRGDQRALSQESIQKIQNGQKQYPTDEQLYEVSGKLLNQSVLQLFAENENLLLQTNEPSN